MPLFQDFINFILQSQCNTLLSLKMIPLAVYSTHVPNTDSDRAESVVSPRRAFWPPAAGRQRPCVSEAPARKPRLRFQLAGLLLSPPLPSPPSSELFAFFSL